MIFVTVGSYKYDELIEEIDKMPIKEEVIMQIGRGEYIPKNCTWYRYKPSILPDIKNARLVVSHEGATTLLQAANEHKPMIVKENPHTIKNPGIILKMEKEGYLWYCREHNDLWYLISIADEHKFKKYTKPKCTIGQIINDHMRWEWNG